MNLAVLDGPSCPAADFITSLDSGDKAKLKVLFQRFADHGFIANREKFKQVADKVFEFKSFQIRMFCFVSGSKCIVTTGVKKKRDELMPADIERHKRIRSQYENLENPQVKTGKRK